MTKKLISVGLISVGLGIVGLRIGEAALFAQKVANPVIVIETNKGNIEIELQPKMAPKGVAKILGLVEKGFYRGLRVHRVTSSLVQMGDPQTRNMRNEGSWGTGGSGQYLGVAEINPMMKHVRGAVGLAYSGDPKFADSQFYIMKNASQGLDGDYSIIGRVVNGITVADRLQKADVIKNITIKPPASKSPAARD
ncbi:MAG: peptidylprolyl isomerase [Acidobacteria bacterium]|nr:MAG: peptidylprolyl isomerase [Acidobacteriota bacterium]